LPNIHAVLDLDDALALSREWEADDDLLTPESPDDSSADFLFLDLPLAGSPFADSPFILPTEV
jgi:hypothetical protein